MERDESRRESQERGDHPAPGDEQERRATPTPSPSPRPGRDFWGPCGVGGGVRMVLL